MSQASTLLVAGVTESRTDDNENSWRRCRTPSQESSQRFGEEIESSWRRCRTPSPDFSYRCRFTNTEHDMLGSSSAAAYPNYQSNLCAANPPFVWVYVPIIEGLPTVDYDYVPTVDGAPAGLVDYDYVPTVDGAPIGVIDYDHVPTVDGAPTGLVDYESQKSGASTPSTEATSMSESPRNLEDTDPEEHPSGEEGVETTYDVSPPSNGCLDPDESLCWLLLDSECSVGSVGHPYACADACKYLRKSKGCKDGPTCPRCHFCRWVAPRHAYRERTRVRQRLRRKVASENNDERQPALND